jgi:hypothetical protein
MAAIFRHVLPVVFLLLSRAAAQEPVPAASAVVEGSVVNCVTGSPVKRAHVRAVRIAPQSEPHSEEDTPETGTDTDAGGRFTLRLEPGSYRLWVERPGFMEQNYGALSPNGAGQALALGPGQELHDVAFRIAPLGAISGRVLDEDGEPVQGAGVDVLKFSYATGRRTLLPVSGVSVNDRGEYRAYNLPPGRYFLLATQRGEPLQRPIGKGRLIADAQEFYAPMYYPGVTEFTGAAPLLLAEGQDLQNADFRLQRVGVFTLRGRLSGPAENFAEGQVQVMLAQREGARASNINRATATIDRSTGRFEFHRVAPGSYVLVASQQWRGRAYAGRLAVEVSGSGHPDNLTVTLTQPFEITGVLQLEGASPAAMKDTQVNLTESEGLAPGTAPSAQAGPDGTFRLPGVTAGLWDLAVAPLPQGAWLKTIEFNGRAVQPDAIDLTAPSPGFLRIVLAGNGARLSGTVVSDGQGRAGTVVLVPSPEELRAFPSVYRVAAASEQGSFAIGGIRPGAYKMFAFDEIEHSAWLDPDFLRTVESSGEEIVLAEGDDAKRVLTAISGDLSQPRR